MNISIVIPAYNEQNQISNSLERILSYISSQKNNFEVIVVDDGSIDKTCEKVKYFPDVKLIKQDKNSGKGAALREGVNQSKYDYVYLCDCDLSTPIEEIEKFINKIKLFDCVVGSRANKKGYSHSSVVRVLFGKFGNFLINSFLRLGIRDTQCGFKLLGPNAKKIFDKTTINRWGIDFEFLYLMKANNLKVKEIDIEWQAGKESKVSLLSYFSSFADLLKVFFKSKIVN